MSPDIKINLLPRAALVLGLLVPGCKVSQEIGRFTGGGENGRPPIETGAANELPVQIILPFGHGGDTTVFDNSHQLPPKLTAVEEELPLPKLKPVPVEDVKHIVKLEAVTADVSASVSSPDMGVQASPAEAVREVLLGERLSFKFSELSGDPKIVNNARLFYARVSDQVGEEEYVGSLKIPPNQEVSVNSIFGYDCYETMPVAGGAPGGGACHAGSMLNEVASRAGLDAKPTMPTHSSPIGGVSDEHELTIWCSPQNPAANADLLLSNPFPEPVVIAWEIKGDKISFEVKRTSFSSQQEMATSAEKAALQEQLLWQYKALGVQEPATLIDENVLNFRVPQALRPPKPEIEEKITYWDGAKFSLEIPDEVWQDSFDAAVFVNGGKVDETATKIALLLVALRSSEHPYFVGGNITSYAGAVGAMQFMPGTAALVGLLDSTNDRASMFAAAKYTHRVMGLTAETDKTGFVANFMGKKGNGTWNQHRGQASYVWQTWQLLQQRVILAEERQDKFAETAPNPEAAANQAIQKLEKLLGIPYKNFGYKDSKGNYGILHGTAEFFQIDNQAGLNCAGFLVEIMRSLYGNFYLSDVVKVRDDRPGSKDPAGEWLWYGYDLVANFKDKFGGRELIVEGLNWQANIGYPVDALGTLASSMQTGKIYLGSVNKEHAREGREHHYVAAFLKSPDGKIAVFEAVPGQGSRRVNLEEFMAAYPQESIYVVEIPLGPDINVSESPAPSTTAVSSTETKSGFEALATPLAPGEERDLGNGVFVRNLTSRPIEAKLLQETLDLGGGPKTPELIRCVAGLNKNNKRLKITFLPDSQLSPQCGSAPIPGSELSGILLNTLCLENYDENPGERPNPSDVFLHELYHVSEFESGKIFLGEASNPLELSDLSLKRLKKCESKTAN